MWQLTVEHLSTHWLQFSLVVLSGLMIGGPIQRMVERYGTLFQGFFWPIRSFCVRCLTPIGWMQRFPLIGPILFGHRCQHCGQSLGWRAVYFPLMSLLAVLVPYFLWVVFGARFRPDLPRQVQFYSYVVEHQWALFIYHAIFFLFLLAAMWTDFDWFLIPDSITFPGMIVGLLLGTFWYVELHPVPVWPGYRHPADFMKEETIRQDLFNGKEIPKWIETFRKSVEFPLPHELESVHRLCELDAGTSVWRRDDLSDSRDHEFCVSTRSDRFRRCHLADDDWYVSGLASLYHHLLFAGTAVRDCVLRPVTGCANLYCGVWCSVCGCYSRSMGADGVERSEHDAVRPAFGDGCVSARDLLAADLGCHVHLLLN